MDLRDVIDFKFNLLKLMYNDYMAKDGYELVITPLNFDSEYLPDKELLEEFAQNLQIESEQDPEIPNYSKKLENKVSRLILITEVIISKSITKINTIMCSVRLILPRIN